LEFVTVTVYVPAVDELAPGLVVVDPVDVQLPGPDHEYDVPPVAESEIVCPSQYGPVLEAPGEGLLFTVTVVLFVAEQLFELVTVT